MSEYYQQLHKKLTEAFSAQFDISATVAVNELNILVSKEQLHAFCAQLKSAEGFEFEQLIDVCGVDYLHWEGEQQFPSRYAVVYHLLSVTHNHRVRLQIFLDNNIDENFPVLDSVVDLWPSANWFEREAFDLFGIVFEGHPDLRRILTDYGFIGHPFRKDFPLIGQVEMRYDGDKKRVVYEPVSIEPRITVPRIVRNDNRYQNDE